MKTNPAATTAPGGEAKKAAKPTRVVGGFFKWVVEIEVSETWVADGFDLTNERAKQMMEKELGYSYGSETRAKVLRAPPAAAIAKAQGES